MNYIVKIILIILLAFLVACKNNDKESVSVIDEKDLDLIVANDPSTFDGDQIKYSIIDRQGKVSDYPRQPKEQAANVILGKLT